MLSCLLTTPHGASCGKRPWNIFIRPAKKPPAVLPLEEAIAYFEQALDALKHLPESRQTIEKAVNIRVDLGPALIATSGFCGTRS